MNRLFKSLFFSALALSASFAEAIVTVTRAGSPGTFIFVGPTLPSTCKLGDLAFDSNASAGSNIYGCTAEPGTWTLQAGGGGGTGCIPAGSANDFLLDDGAGGCSTLTPASGVATFITTPSGANLATALTTALPATKGGTGLTALGTGIATALGINVGSAGAPIVLNGAGGTPSSIVLTNATGTAAGLTAGAASALAANPADCAANNFATTIAANGDLTCGQPSVSAGISGLGAGIATALGINTGSAGAPVLFNGAGGTPSSIVLTNATGTAASLTAGTASAVAVGGITGLGTGVATALAVNVGSAGAPVVFNGAGGTPSSLTGTNITGTASGLTAGAATALAANPTDCSANNFATTIAANGDLTCAQPSISAGVSGLGTGVATALAVNTGSTGAFGVRVIGGTSALGTSAISSATCATVVTTSATGTATTDVINWGFNDDPTAVTGYVPLTSGMLTIIAYPTANNVNYKVCNNTAGSITPGAITLNWVVIR